MLAFHNDAKIKRDLHDSLARHIEAGTLEIGETHWDGTKGSPLGVSANSTDVDSYAAMFGYPVPLAGLLDPLTDMMGPHDATLAFVRAWVERVEPGADLATVPGRLMLHMLRTVELDGECDTMKADLLDLHQRDLTGTSPARKEWSALRETIAAALEEAHRNETGPILSLDLLEAACWPAARGYTPLSGTFAAYIEQTASGPDPDWGTAESQQCQVFFDALAEERRDELEAGEWVDFGAIFKEREPELSRRFDAYNERYADTTRRAATSLGERCLELLETAPTATSIAV